jgi:hypothetical protein
MMFFSALLLLWFVSYNNIPVHGLPDTNDDHKKPSVVFGTENGYDVGGTDPLCWESRLNSTAEVDFPTSVEKNEYDSIETLNQELFDSDDPDVQLLPDCPNGTIVSVTPLDLDAPLVLLSDDKGGSDKVIYTEQTYTFRLNIQLNVSNLVANWTVPPDGFVFIHCRLHLCDTTQQGFCNPLADTRERDATLTRADTDMGGDNQSMPPLMSDKWAYSEGTPLKGLTDKADGSKIYSRWIKWKLRQTNTDTDLYKTEVDMSLWLPKNTNPGVYFFIGHVVVDFKSEEESNTIRRIDITQAIPGNVVQVQAEPQILYASKSSKIWLGLASSVIGCYAIYCFGFIVWHRKHPVMQLSQGSLLSAIAFFCFLIALFSFTFLPTNDSFCSMNGPLVHVPITAIGAILLGRVWRIYSTLNVANALGRCQMKNSKVETRFVQILDYLSGSQSCCNFSSFQTNDYQADTKRRTSFRRTVTALETARLICILTFPQIVLQITSSIFVEDGLDIEVTPEGNVGRVVCSNVSWVRISTTCISAFVYFLAVLMAWISRDLPSAFNEKNQIFNAATIGTILVVMAIVLGQITDQPTSSPDVAVFLDSSCAIGIACSVLSLIIHPKIARVRSGDKVVVSSLLGSKFLYNASPGEESYGGFVQQRNSQEKMHTLDESSTSNGSDPRIVLCQDQPMPSHIEQKMLDVQSTLRSITEHFGDGRSITKEEWKLMCEEISHLKKNLDQVDFEDGTKETFHEI